MNSILNSLNGEVTLVTFPLTLQSSFIYKFSHMCENFVSLPKLINDLREVRMECDNSPSHFPKS